MWMTTQIVKQNLSQNKNHGDELENNHNKYIKD